MGTLNDMGMTQEEKTALSENWEQAKVQVRSQFAGVNDDDLDDGQGNAPDIDQLKATLAEKAGVSATDAENSLKRIAKQYQ